MTEILKTADKHEWITPELISFAAETLLQSRTPPTGKFNSTFESTFAGSGIGFATSNTVYYGPTS